MKPKFTTIGSDVIGSSISGSHVSGSTSGVLNCVPLYHTLLIPFFPFVSPSLKLFPANTVNVPLKYWLLTCQRTDTSASTFVSFQINHALALLSETIRMPLPNDEPFPSTFVPSFELFVTPLAIAGTAIASTIVSTSAKDINFFNIIKTSTFFYSVAPLPILYQ